MCRITICLILTAVLSACGVTTYQLSRCEGEGASKVCVEGKAKTRRKFETFEFKGNMQTGELMLKGSKVSSEFSPLEHAAADLLRKIDPATGVNPLPE